jgi:hypothetical protein
VVLKTVVGHGTAMRQVDGLLAEQLQALLGHAERRVVQLAFAAEDDGTPVGAVEPGLPKCE